MAINDCFCNCEILDNHGPWTSSIVDNDSGNNKREHRVSINEISHNTTYYVTMALREIEWHRRVIVIEGIHDERSRRSKYTFKEFTGQDALPEAAGYVLDREKLLEKEFNLH